MDANVRQMRVDARAFAAEVAEFVAYRILDLERDEIQALQRTALGAYLDHDGAADIEPVEPGQGVCRLVYVFLAAVAVAADAPQYAAGDTAFQVDAVAQFEWSAETDAAVGGLQCACAERLQFGCKRGFQAARARGEKVFRHDAKIW